MNCNEYRDWGYYRDHYINAETFRIKQINLKPDYKVKINSINHENLLLLKGSVVIVQKNKATQLQANDYFTSNEKFTIVNNNNVEAVLIKVQTGPLSDSIDIIDYDEL